MKQILRSLTIVLVPTLLSAQAGQVQGSATSQTAALSDTRLAGCTRSEVAPSLGSPTPSPSSVPTSLERPST